MAFAAPSRRPPWQPAELLAVLATTAVGLVVIAAGWIGVSGAVAPHKQMVWLDVAAAGVLVAGVGNGLWLLAGRRALGERRRRITAAIAGDDAPATHAAVILEVEQSDRLVAAQKMTRYHRDDCILVGDKPVRAATREAHERAGRGPCGVCAP